MTQLKVRYLHDGGGLAIMDGNVTSYHNGEDSSHDVPGQSTRGLKVYTVGQRMADETRPVNIAMPVILYLGNSI